MDMVKKAISKPTWYGNFNFSNPGMSTFPKDIATPISIVPNISNPVVPSERRTIPKANRIVDKNKVSSSPSLRATIGAKGDMMAKASNGIVVRKPANTLEIPRSSRIKDMIGPTTVNGIRNVEAIKITPKTKSNVVPFQLIFLLG